MAEKVKRLSAKLKYFAPTREAADLKIKEVIELGDGIVVGEAVKQKVHKDAGTYYELTLEMDYNNSQDILDAGFFEK